jgi:hypothetical protein
MLEIVSGTQNEGDREMILNTTDKEYEMLKNELMSLIQKSEDGLDKAFETAISAGLATLMEPLPINRLLIERALKAIDNQSGWERIERDERQIADHAAKEAFFKAEELNQLDRVDQDFFWSLAYDREIFFGEHDD